METTKGGNIFIYIICLAIGVGVGYFLFKDNTDLSYSNGDPSNCRAIIAENIQGFNDGTFTADDALASIDRNCGKDGYSW